MGFLIRILLIALTLGIGLLIQNIRQLTRPLPAPKLNFETYWGPGPGRNYREDQKVKSFDISTKPELIEDLKTVLSRPLKLHDPLEGVRFEYGFNSKMLEKIVTYWRDSYLPKWTEREAYLKKFPHFQTQIQGLNIHFIHVKPKRTGGKKVLPLLLLHGWPGSVREFYDLIPLLTTPNANSGYVFEVVAPSLPGYGWSQAPSKISFGPAQMSIVLGKLMLRLGHTKFVVQGGDWGSIVGANVATFFPNNVIAYHSNMCTVGSPLSIAKLVVSSFWPSLFYEPHQESYFLPAHRMLTLSLEEMAYAHLQATKPDTIGTALAHNPVGLAAYILEKFSIWTNKDFVKLADGGLTQRFTLDALLDNVMIYQLTNSITTSQRLYAEHFSKQNLRLEMDRVQINVPTGCARFKNELSHFSDWQLKERFANLVHSSYHSDGGHFAAMEMPQTLYADLNEFLKKALKRKPAA